MSLEEIKKSDLWKKLERNQAFDSNFERAKMKVSRYKSQPKFEIVDDKLVVTLLTEVCQRDPITECRRVRIYEFSVDEDNKLLLYKKKGTISTRCNEEYTKSNSGNILVKYSCVLFDGDGIVLSYQEYTDDRVLEGLTLNEYREKPIEFVNEAHDPHLIYSTSENQTNEKQIVCLAPGIIGSDNNKYIKMYRNANELEITHKVTTSFYPNGALKNFTHNLFISTLSSDGRINYTPEYINVGDDREAFATMDIMGNVYPTTYGISMGITKANCNEIARGRFLNELLTNRDIMPKVPDVNAVIMTLNRLINKVAEEKDNEKNEGTMR